MKPRSVLAIFLAGSAVAIALFLKGRWPAPSPEVVVAPVQPKVATNLVMTRPSVSPMVRSNLTPEERSHAIDVEKDKLYAWSMNQDPQSLSNILGDLTSSEKEIRMGAIEAAKQFGDPRAVPVLKAMAANAEDNEEAIAMLEAADFISLPSVTWSKADPNRQKTPAEIQAIAAQNAKVEARRQADLQKHGGQAATSTDDPQTTHGPGATSPWTSAQP